jgi:hypothetical protein
MKSSACALLVALCCAGALPAVCAAPARATETGSGQPAGEVRTVAEFQAIALAGSIDLLVRQGGPPSVRVEAEADLLPLIETVVETRQSESTLVVRWKRGDAYRGRGGVRVTVVVPRLSAVAAAGSGDVTLESLNTPALKLVLSGSGGLRFSGLVTDDLSLRLSGSGDAKGSGKARRLAIRIAGSGSVKMPDLSADEVSIGIAGSGDAEVNAQQTLDVSVAGSGSVVYSGNAAVKTSMAGSGSVKRK